MIELSPYYFSSSEKDKSFTISYYPINKQWRIVLTHKKNSMEYWVNLDQAINIKDLFIESVEEANDIKGAIIDES